jgi:hypothetical protein
LLGFLAFELIINLEPLSTSLQLKVGLPWHPLGLLAMPVWVALLGLGVFAFILAAALEVAAWYEYTRTIHLQRLQIQALKTALEKKTAPSQNSAP